MTIGNVFSVVKDVTNTKTTNQINNCKWFDKCLLRHKTSGMSSVCYAKASWIRLTNMWENTT